MSRPRRGSMHILISTNAYSGSNPSQYEAAFDAMSGGHATLGVADADSLAAADVVVYVLPSIAIPAEEMQRLKEWVEAGGRLILFSEHEALLANVHLQALLDYLSADIDLPAYDSTVD